MDAIGLMEDATENPTAPWIPFLAGLIAAGVASSHPVQFSINRAPVSEVLDFRIPANARIRQFNEITVLLQPAPERALAGAKIAIQQFMLVPRGL